MKFKQAEWQKERVKAGKAKGVIEATSSKIAWMSHVNDGEKDPKRIDKYPLLEAAVTCRGLLGGPIWVIFSCINGCQDAGSIFPNVAFIWQLRIQMNAAGGYFSTEYRQTQFLSIVPRVYRHLGL